MKKYLFIAVAAVAVTFTSCKNEPKPVEPTEPEVEEVEYVAADSLQSFIERADTTAISSFLTQAQEKIQQLDPAVAKEYLAKIQAILKENADKIKAFVGTGAVASLIDTVNALPEIEVNDVVDQAKEAVEGATDAVNDAAADAVEGAKDAVEGAKDAAAEAVEGAKDAAAEAVDAAADEVKGALSK